MSDLVFFEYPNQNNNINKPKYLVILLHGYGANGANLISLGQEFAKYLPNCHFIAPNAPQNWEGGFADCYQWFSLAKWGTDRDASKISDLIINANNNLQDFIKKQLDRFNLTTKNLFLVGFSQGAMMAIYQALTAKEPIAGVISYSGKVILPESIGKKSYSKPKICLMHGKQDSVLPFDYFIEAQQILKQQNIEFQAHPLDNLDHSIDMRGVEIGKNFLLDNIEK